MTDFCFSVSRSNTSKKYLNEYTLKESFSSKECLDFLFWKYEKPNKTSKRTRQKTQRGNNNERPPSKYMTPYKNLKNPSSNFWRPPCSKIETKHHLKASSSLNWQHCWIIAGWAPFIVTISVWWPAIRKIAPSSITALPSAHETNTKFYILTTTGTCLLE